MSDILAISPLCLAPLYISQDSRDVDMTPAHLAVVAGLQLTDHCVVEHRHGSKVHRAGGLGVVRNIKTSSTILLLTFLCLFPVFARVCEVADLPESCCSMLAKNW